jgi:hypothetical protein
MTGLRRGVKRRAGLRRGSATRGDTRGDAQLGYEEAAGVERRGRGLRFYVHEAAPHRPTAAILTSANDGI